MDGRKTLYWERAAAAVKVLQQAVERMGDMQAVASIYEVPELFVSLSLGGLWSIPEFHAQRILALEASRTTHGAFARAYKAYITRTEAEKAGVLA